MKISLSPQRRDDLLTVSKTGDSLTLNGEVFDFSSLPDGATIPEFGVPCTFIFGKVERISGELHLTLRLPHGPDPELWQAFPEPLISPPDGELDLPWNTYTTEISEAVEGGVNITTTTYRWHQDPQIETVFVPDPVEEEELANVDA